MKVAWWNISLHHFFIHTSHTSSNNNWHDNLLLTNRMMLPADNLSNHSDASHHNVILNWGSVGSATKSNAIATVCPI